MRVYSSVVTLISTQRPGFSGDGAHAGVARGLEALRAGGVAPKLLVIDDGWQSSCVESPSDSLC